MIDDCPSHHDHQPEIVLFRQRKLSFDLFFRRRELDGAQSFCYKASPFSPLISFIHFDTCLVQCQSK